MDKNAKIFAKKLNHFLDSVSMPTDMRERTYLFARMMRITKMKARQLLEGRELPEKQLLKMIAMEMDVEESSLV